MKTKFLLIILIACLVFISACAEQDHNNQDSHRGDGPQFNYDNEDLTPVPAPNVEGKIQGYWSSQANMVISDLDDAEKMKEIGINTVTFSPLLSHTQEGLVTEQQGTESMIKFAINKAHSAGFRVMLETTPMNAGEIAPLVTDPELFQSEMTRVAIKYAKIAEEYNVEYFAPIVEPVHHMSVEESDKWMQEVLPKLREVYSGPLMWKKQEMHLTETKEWDQDHIMEIGFRLSGSSFRINMKSSYEHKILLDIKESMIRLEEWVNNEEKLEIEHPINIDKSEWHLLNVEIEDQQIRIFMDNEMIIEHEDDSGVIGGYSLSSDGVRINQFEITDLSGVPLLVEDFNNLNNWKTRYGWELEDNEIIVTSTEESSLVHDVDFSGYDYIAIDTFKRGQVHTNEEYIEYLRFVIDKTNQQAETDGVPYVIIAEFGGSIMEEIGWIDTDERAKIPMTEDELAEVTRMVLELAEDKVDGYMYNGWDIEGQGINVLPKIEAVIREWYNSH
ncbi:hypothetical protein ACFLQN_00635 [Candidatus Aenigmatarchaeota archaeon]